MSLIVDERPSVSRSVSSNSSLPSTPPVAQCPPSRSSSLPVTPPPAFSPPVEVKIPELGYKWQVVVDSWKQVETKPPKTRRQTRSKTKESKTKEARSETQFKTVPTQITPLKRKASSLDILADVACRAKSHAMSREFSLYGESPPRPLVSYERYMA